MAEGAPLGFDWPCRVASEYRQEDLVDSLCQGVIALKPQPLISVRKSDLPFNFVPGARHSVFARIAGEVDKHEPGRDTVLSEKIQDSQSIGELIVAIEPIAFLIDAQGALEAGQSIANLPEPPFLLRTTTRFQFVQMGFCFDKQPFLAPTNTGLANSVPIPLRPRLRPIVVPCSMRGIVDRKELQPLPFAV